MTDNYPAGSKDRTDAPYNYDPEQALVECENCGEFIKLAMAKEFDKLKFCDDYCLNRFLNE